MTRNLVLIVLDTVRKDYFDEYATRIQQLSDLDFKQCRAASSCSVPSHGAILTGRLPHESGISYTRVRYNDVPRSDTFLSSLTEHRTFGVSANVWAGTEFGFGEYFDDFVDISPHRRFQRGMDVTQFALDESDATGASLYVEFLKAALRRDHTFHSLANGIFAQVNRWLSKAPIPKPFDDGASVICREIQKHISDDTKPFFCFTNFMDAHAPMHHVVGYDKSLHDAPYYWSSLNFDSLAEVTYNIDHASERYQNFIETYRGLYAAAIDYLDRRVSDFIRTVQAETDRETTFVITADHGENLGFESEDGYFGHNSSLSEALLHVPLSIVNPPDGLYGEVETRYFSHLELGDLLVSLATEEPADIFRDVVPAELINGEMDELKPLVSEDVLKYHSRAQRCVITDDTKYVWDSLDGSATYRLDSERPNWQEQTDTDADLPDWVHDPFAVDLAMYRSRVEAATPYAKREDIPDHTKDRLGELGYL